ncbi:hypothetical protein LTR56_020700 [Elasticomyces elasticus]|nr:hypothetical protein LTR56_020700 [Elasticomyces elasticus]KAK4904358.1 hypothetical protein LTR49_026172 [Elasticomyces elasticus]KAK5747626.1 hypothetical protein LTS12_022324 [Elasticomyces elasticus]
MEGRQARDWTSLGQYNDASKHRAQHYEDQFRSTDGEVGTVRTRVQRESTLIADLKTNVIIKDEFTFVIDLSYHLAQRYNRPDSSIMVKLDHSACLAFGGTFDPCYILNITILPSDMGPTINKRNATLVQSFMADILGVSSDRGIIKFQPIEEADYAMDGTTMLDQMEKLQRHHDERCCTAVQPEVTGASRKGMPSLNKKSAPKLYTDVEALNGTPTTTGITPVERRQRSDSAKPPPLSILRNVFELPAPENERPLTAGEGAQFTAVNGLRKNRISKEDLYLLSSKPTGERPKTVAASTPHRSVQDQSKGEALPRPQRQSSYHTTSKRSSMIQDEPKKGNIPISPQLIQSLRPLTTSIIRPSEMKSTGSKPSAPSGQSTVNTYLDGVSTTTRPKTGQPVDPNIDVRAAEKNRQVDNQGEDTTASTVKRKSTVTATPRMPLPLSVPEEKRRPEPRKRKSFLSAFRRN